MSHTYVKVINMINKLKDNGHKWKALDGDVRCVVCDARPSGASAKKLCIRFDLERMQGSKI